MINRLSKKQKAELILFVIVLLFCLILYFFMSFFSKDGSFIKVYRDGELIGEYSLLENRSIDLSDGEDINILVIEDGACYMSDANCDDKICINEGKIQRDGETIVCLPHKLVVEVFSEDDAEVDTATR